MRYHNSIIELVGDTPLVKLNKVAEGISATVLAKVEYFNPGGSAKDRIAMRMIEAAEASGELKPGGTIVEPTSGNTGVGLALVAQQKGYKCVFVCPDKVSTDKINTLRAYGAEVVVCPTAVAPEHPDSYYNVSDRLVREIPNAWKPNQYANPENPASHYHSTGPEIWAQTDGRVDGFISAVGSGGTLAGVAQALRERKPDVQIGLADPHGAALYAYYTDGELRAEGTSISEGIGQGRITANLVGLTIDRPYRISDEEMLLAIYDLVEHEGLVMGGSTGINVAGAIRMAKDMGPGHTIVTILCDHGSRYQSKIYNPPFLKEKGLPPPPWIPA